jgi:hypothetical protein
LGLRSLGDLKAPETKEFNMKVLFATILFALALAASAAGAVQKPGLPTPMPRIVADKCPYDFGFPTSGCAYCDHGPDGDGSVIYLPPNTYGGRFTKLHEVGHAFVCEMVDEGERNKIGRLEGFKPGRWTDTAAERTADVYANCRMGYQPPPPTRMGQWTAASNWSGWTPSRKRAIELCATLTRAGLDVNDEVSTRRP